ncbi:hypothetical protein K437DRAFT_257210 [Tilletiaria anomala UBC 951]|uniref:Uncharacterized protein n=1 Tax=Tilletiaria anomala (strain ATCC 24038 / CBS 436.72 / UBC 951) TaxID=1037660 RepID=A0A066VUW3_TILAU|nr:uncharacterized protein K437DRAFT_257210 [Tilletiaria anomala UBC 951]KDN44073.1 hypothetical protein K437DRAFT_257210 [Tilletiaria anomala UBC 951]
MVKAGKLKRSERRQPEPQIEVGVPKADSTGAHSQHHAPPPPPRSSTKKGAGGRQRGSLSSAKARAKREKALEREEKLEVKKIHKALREDKVKAAKS